MSPKKRRSMHNFTSPTPEPSQSRANPDACHSKPTTFKEIPYAGESPTLLPTDPKERKGVPIVTGVLDYFPNALAEVARVSKAGNDQHNPGQPLHWSRGKSTDHADCAGRHLIERGGRDSDGQRHTAKLAWRALALLEEELEAEGAPISRGSK